MKREAFESEGEEGSAVMKFWHLLLLVLAMVLIAFPLQSPSADSNSCVSCHTDGAKLKSLVIPPKIHAEGEG